MKGLDRADGAWRKSSFSGGGDSDDCVEIAAAPDALHLRESDETGVAMTTARPQLAALITHLRRT
ncbi:DUF397 domain-containing protein [Streptomyces sp. NBC_01515]|uniref:DUF397 domain-containing protein n=1 Tax=Streptomyces sp. NBC_01515 TaxID=2903890 RepID=UPI00386CB374